MKALMHILCVAIAFCLCLSLLGCNNGRIESKTSLRRSDPDASSAISIEDSSETEDSSGTGDTSIPSSSEHVIVSSHPPYDGGPPINSPDPSIYSSEESKDSVSSDNNSDSNSRQESSAETSSDLVSSAGNSSKTVSFESKYDLTKYPHPIDHEHRRCEYNDKHIVNYPVLNGGKEIIVREGEYVEVSVMLKDPEKPEIQLMMEGVDDHDAQFYTDIYFTIKDPDIAVLKHGAILDNFTGVGIALGKFNDMDRQKVRIYGNKKGSTTLSTWYSEISLYHPDPPNIPKNCYYDHHYEAFGSDPITVTVI